jgi:hypothetical protein
MRIEALTERYQTRRKTALNRVLVEPEKFAQPPGRDPRRDAHSFLGLRVISRQKGCRDVVAVSLGLTILSVMCW